MTKRSLRFTSILCVLLLLFAQHSAFAHAAFHAHGDQAPAHEEDQSDKSFQSTLCALHGAFGQVLGGVEPDIQHNPAFRCALECTAHLAAAPVFPEPHVPLSRGPPSFS